VLDVANVDVENNILDWKHCVRLKGNMKHTNPKEKAQEIKENIN